MKGGGGGSTCFSGEACVRGGLRLRRRLRVAAAVVMAVLGALDEVVE
jgi:hypothetical protein